MHTSRRSSTATGLVLRSAIDTMRSVFTCCPLLASAICARTADAQRPIPFSVDDGTWMAADPDGRTIAFELRGDIYSIEPSGGSARVFRACARVHVATPTRRSVRMRTRLYAAFVKAKSRRTPACPRWCSFRSPPMVLPHPNDSSTSFRFT